MFSQLSIECPCPDSTDEDSKEWRLFEFSDGLCCYSHSSFEETAVIHKELFLDHEYMRDGIVLRDGDCLFDVGANIGLFTIYANRPLTRLVTYAFEPMAPTYSVLLANLRLHRLGRVRALQYGLGARCEAAKEFTYYLNMPGNSTTRPETKGVHRLGMRAKHTESQIELAFESERVNAQVRTLSSVIDEYNVRAIDLLKIDVEGAELDVLAGVEARHWGMIRQIVLEVHDAATTCACITDQLAARGFRVSTGANEPNWAGNMNVYGVRPGG